MSRRPLYRNIPWSPAKPADVHFKNGTYPSLTVDTWAICSAAMAVSHARLDRVLINKQYGSEMLTWADMHRVEDGLRHAFGFPIVP